MFNRIERRRLYKVAAIFLISYAVFFGFTINLPYIKGNLQQTSRNIFYHVPMWFSMVVFMMYSLYHSIMYLRKNLQKHDDIAKESAKIGVLFGLLGLFTGSVWSRVTWGETLLDSDPTAWWAWDPKQTMALVGVMMYFAYFILRNSFDEEQQRARISAIYNIFAAAALIPLLFVVPRILGGLHPGGDSGDPIFNQDDLSMDFRIIFWPSVLGFVMIGFWILELHVRMIKIKRTLTEE